MVTPAPHAPGTTALEEELRRLAGSVPDPELPMVSLAELGVLRGLRVLAPGRVEVELTPTYTGCPALETMAADIERVLHDRGVAEVDVRTVLAPPWTTRASTNCIDVVASVSSTRPSENTASAIR